MVELDVTNQDDLDALADRVKEHVDGLDGVLHSIGFAPQAPSAATSSTPLGGRRDRGARLGLLAQGARPWRRCR